MHKNICWIETIHVAKAAGRLREVYERVKTPHGTVDNVYQAQSLRPRTMAAHDALYRSVLHCSDNTLPAWFLETVAVYTSLINRCDYAVAHHFENVRRLLEDRDRSRAVYEALSAGRPEAAFSGKELELLRYTEKLTSTPDCMVEADIQGLKQAGAEDGEILEVNQVCACFNYANRLINGLGVSLGDDVIGFSLSSGSGDDSS